MKRALRKAAVLGLSACLAMTSLAGCSKKEFDAEAVALTVNGSTASVGLVKFMSHYLQAYTETMYDSYYGVNSFVMDLDGTGTTLGDMVVESNVSGLTQMMLAEQKMGEYGVELTEDEKAAITAAATAFIEANEEEVLTKMCATQENVERYLELITIQAKLEPEMQKAVDTEVSDEEAAQYTIQYAYFAAQTEAETEAMTEAVTEADAQTEAETAAETTVETEAETAAETTVETTVETEAETAALEDNAADKTQAAEETEAETEDPAMAAAMEEAYALAAQMIEKVESVDDFETVFKELKGEDAAVVIRSIGAEDTSISEAILAAAENLADGEVYATPVETASGYYVVQMVSTFDREATDARKLEIIEERKSELVSSLYTEWEAAAEVKVEEKVVDTIKFDFALMEATEAATEATTEATTEAATEAATEAVTEAVTE